MRRIRDLIDEDGTDVKPMPDEGPDERAGIWMRGRQIDGLVEIRGLLDQVDGEALLTALDAYETPDAAGTPVDAQRSPGQRRADALGALLRTVLDAGATPIVGGNKPHLLMTVDLDTLLSTDGRARRERPAGGDDGAAAPTDWDTLLNGTEPRPPRLRFTGTASPAIARRIARNAKVTAVLTMGPWRVVNVGRTMRILPPWLRAVLEVVHRRCRGPDCDRPAVWAEAHHIDAWDRGGDTDLNRMVPLCKAHHDLVTSGRWRVDFDPDSGVCTCAGPAGRLVDTHPPP